MVNIQKIFGTAMEGVPSSPRLARKQLPLEQIRQSLKDAARDCKDVRAQRVLFKIDSAKTPHELWLLRSDLHQCIAQEHSQQVAVARINDLVSLFKGWLPDKQLSRI